MGKERNAEFYNGRFKVGGGNGKYFRDARNLEYYPSWKKAYDFIKEKEIKRIIDFGCGPGHFPSLFKNEDEIIYYGYDFSNVAIEQAKERCKNIDGISFNVMDLKEYECKENDNFYVAFEFLEHISFDLELIGKLNKGDKILFSVPNFDSPGHVRWYTSDKQIIDRFGGLLNLTKVARFGGIYLYYGIKK